MTANGKRIYEGMAFNVHLRQIAQKLHKDIWLSQRSQAVIAKS
jgi:hypothetical protein